MTPKSIIIIWIPRHLDLRGMDFVDLAANKPINSKKIMSHDKCLPATSQKSSLFFHGSIMGLILKKQTYQ